MPVATTLKLAWQGFLDVFYPPLCLVCGAGDAPPVCDRCYGAFQPLPEPVCACCGRPDAGSGCRSCTERATVGGWGFDGARAAGIYQGPLREAVHRLKFQRAEMLGEPLGAYLAQRVANEGLLEGSGVAMFDVVIPVPLHPSKERKRGYNQCALIAAPLATELGVPLAVNALVRTRSKTAQVGLSGKARRENLSREDFSVAKQAMLGGKNVLLVDDVFTTGTTLSACASVLKAAGAERVVAVALAAGG